jgi:hypothetical protein
MAGARKKATKAKTHPHEKTLSRAGLTKSSRMTAAHRKKIAKLSGSEVKALVSAKKKLGYKGSMHGKGADIF